jgi:cell division septation protein DedD
VAETPMTTKNTRRFEFKLGRIGVIVFLLGISGLLFGVFLLGVTVGKNIDTYPEKIARFLPDKLNARLGLPPGAEEPVLAARDQMKQEKPEPDLQMTFHDRLVKGKQEKVPSPSPEPVIPEVQPKPAAPALVVEKAQPVKEKPAVREEFIVQVASYQEKSKAEALIKKISGMGYPSQTEVINLPDKGKWFRVVMGAFSSRSEAQKAVDAVSGKNKGLNCVIRSVDGVGN